MTRKYKLLSKKLVKFTNSTGQDIEQKMYRIKALRDIPYHNVKAGDLGGWVNDKYILSQEDNSWIGGEAVVYAAWCSVVRVRDNALVTDKAVIYGHESTKITLGQNAVVEDNAKVFARDSRTKVVIYGSAQISENAIVEHPKTITGRIAGNASVRSSSNVLEGSQVIGNAVVSLGSTVEGKARIMGNAVVTSGARVSENAVITDDAKVSAAEIRGTATVSGNAQIEEQSVVCDSATVTDHAVINKNAIIANLSIIKDNAVVLESTRVLGESIISGATVTKSYRDYTDFVSAGRNPSLSTTPKLKELTETVPPVEANNSDVQKILLKLAGLEQEINAYGNDIVKLLKFPVMNDLRDENTLEMMLALKNSKSIDPEENPDGFREAVNSLERKFMKAESNALILSSAAFSDEQRKKAEKASYLFAVACNEASSEQEKRSAFKQGFRQLVGVVAVTNSAIENMRVKVGIPELEA